MTTFLTSALASTEAIASTEAAVDIESIKEIMDGFDPASLLPELGQVFSTMATVCRIAVLAGPIVLLILGLAYLFLAPKEANYYFGYRCYYGMGSVQAWRFTQRIAGMILGGLGLILTGVMLVISGSFAAMDAMDMVWKAFWCLLWQAVIALLANVAIWAVTFFRFDARGNYRNKKKLSK